VAPPTLPTPTPHVLPAPVLPTLTCVRCGVAFDDAPSLRAHFRALHAVTRPSEDGGDDGDSGSEGSDEEGESDGDGDDGGGSDGADGEGKADGGIGGGAGGDVSRRRVGPLVAVRVAETGAVGYVYRAVLESSGDAAAVEYAGDRHATAVAVLPAATLLAPGERWVVLMFASGFFEAALFQMSPAAADLPAAASGGGAGGRRAAGGAGAGAGGGWPQTLMHKRHHRYTTRRKQGGSQSAHDAARGSAAQSVGAQLRRAGEVHLWGDIAGVVGDAAWRPAIAACRRIWIACPKAARPKLYDGVTLVKGDPRIAFLPLMTGRPSLAEASRAAETMATMWPAPPPPPVVAAAPPTSVATVASPSAAVAVAVPRTRPSPAAAVTVSSSPAAAAAAAASPTAGASRPSPAAAGGHGSKATKSAKRRGKGPGGARKAGNGGGGGGGVEAAAVEEAGGDSDEELLFADAMARAAIERDAHATAATEAALPPEAAAGGEAAPPGRATRLRGPPPARG